MSIPVRETLDRKQPIAGKDLKGAVATQAEVVNEKATAAFEVSNSTATVRDSLKAQDRLRSSVTQANTRFSKLTELQSEATDLRNKASRALSTVEAYVANATTAIVAIKQLYTLPSRFITAVKNRFGAFKEQLDSLFALIDPNGRDEYGSKLAAEAEGAFLLSAVALAAVTPSPDGADYQKRQDVIDAIEFISDLRESYINYTDSVTSGNPGDVNVYYANAEAIAAVNELVSLTTSALYEILFETKQERKEILTAASNPILLTHRFYGMEPDADGQDANLEFFIETNNLSMQELIEIPAGREVVYYVG
jgi:hypothetical protein